MNDEQAIRELVREWLEASRRGDLQAVLGLMAEDVVFLTPGQAPMQGKDAFAVGFKAGLERYRIEAQSEIREIELLGEWAYCWSHLNLSINPFNGAQIRLSGPILSILKRQEGRWVIFRDANMLAAQSN